jgi:hypothetical protein
MLAPRPAQLRMSKRQAFAAAKLLAERVRPHVHRLKPPLRARVQEALASLDCCQHSGGELGFIPVLVWEVLGILGVGLAALGFVWTAQTGSELRRQFADAAGQQIPSVAESIKDTAVTVMETVKWVSIGLGLLFVWRQVAK